ncbi:hypothetical protein MNBD_DELTA01-234 [hydrothermal vent metagenome]|uniref:Roadblock/LAMTOR2 domain-containing protein n=1 Tax=hydrothermal vent metagenome TaxID=652676 RepID=A0A3B0RCT2_9ZZZZ
MSFNKILMELTIKLGAKGAAILDAEGETVDIYTELPEFELDFIGARTGLILPLLEKATTNLNKGRVKSLGITTQRLRIAISTIQDGYFLLVATAPEKPLTRTILESEKTVKGLVAEMG